MNHLLHKIKNILKIEVENNYNIWTIRLSPPYPSSDSDYDGTSSLFDSDTEDEIRAWLSSLPDDSRILAFSETAKEHPWKHHYHIRIAMPTIWKTRKSIFDSIHTHLPQLKGNGGFSTKMVQVKGKQYSSIEKSCTYVAKDGDCIYSQGYSLTDLSLFTEAGQTLKNFSKLPLYIQIIKTYDIKKHHTGSTIVDQILEYYQDHSKEPPIFRNICSMLQRIKVKVDSQYRTAWLRTSAHYYDNLRDELNEKINMH